jgi:hypothetical protein
MFRARLENLVKSASMYKTKACGVVRHSATSNMSTSGFAPSTVIIEHDNFAINSNNTT